MKIGVLVLVLMSGFVLGAEPSAPVGAEDVERVNEIIGNYSPLDESGDVNFSKYVPFRTKAEERIDAINEYVGPFTRVMWGVELELSWVFLFSLMIWGLMVVFIVSPLSEIFSWNIWWSLVGAVIIASLAMQGFGKDFVVWMNSFMIQWWVGLVVFVGLLTVGVVYSVFFRFVGRWARATREADKKAGVERDRKILHVEAKLIRDSFGEK